MHIENYEDAAAMFEELVEARPDTDQWVSGFWGYDLVCDCGSPFDLCVILYCIVNPHCIVL